MLNLSIIVPFINQPKLTWKSLKFLVDNKTNPETKIIALNNGSNVDIKIPEGVEYVEFEENIGNYPIFKEILELTKTSLLGVIHNDLFVYEKGFDDRIIQTFEENQQLGLLGFIGSNEIDVLGGRGLGTVSNFQGKEVSLLEGDATKWRGTSAEVHGKRLSGFQNAAVIDGCSMFFRRKALEEIQFREDWPIHHFYDRLMSCQMLEKKWQVGVLGIECDHISNQTVGNEEEYYDLAKNWCFDYLGITEPKQWIELNRQWYENSENPSHHSEISGWDWVIYQEAQKRFLNEWRDVKHFIPLKV